MKNVVETTRVFNVTFDILVSTKYCDNEGNSKLFITESTSFATIRPMFFAKKLSKPHQDKFNSIFSEKIQLTSTPN